MVRFLSPVYSRYQTTDRGHFGHSIAKLARFFTDFHKTLLNGERLRLDVESGNIRIGDKGFIPPPQVHFLRPCRSPELREAINVVCVTMLQNSPHVIHFNRILDFGEGMLGF